MTRLEELEDLLRMVVSNEDLTWYDFWPLSHDEPAIWAREAYDGSLDSAKKAHEVFLPEWEWMLHDDGCAAVFVPSYTIGGRDRFSGNATNPARAWLIAIIYALIELERSK